MGKRGEGEEFFYIEVQCDNKILKEYLDLEISISDILARIPLLMKVNKIKEVRIKIVKEKLSVINSIRKGEIINGKN